MSAATVIRKYGHLTAVLLGGILVSFTVYQLGNRLFQIKKIEVAGNGVNVIVDQNRIPKNLLFFPTEKLREQILKDNPLIAQVTFGKKLPHTLIIVAAMRIPIAQLNSLGGPTVIDREGIVLPPPNTSAAALPVLKFPVKTADIGRPVADQQILASLSFIEKTKSFLTITAIEATDSASLRVITPKIDIFIPQDADVSQEAATLQTLVAGFRIKGNLPTKIDLRFDKPIISF